MSIRRCRAVRRSENLQQQYHGERQDENKAYCLASSLIVWEMCSGKHMSVGVTLAWLWHSLALVILPVTVSRTYSPNNVKDSQYFVFYCLIVALTLSDVNSPALFALNLSPAHIPISSVSLCCVHAHTLIFCFRQTVPVCRPFLFLILRLILHLSHCSFIAYPPLNSSVFPGCLLKCPFLSWFMR